MKVYKTVHLTDTSLRQYRKCAACGARYWFDTTLGGKVGGKRTVLESLLRCGVSQHKAKSMVERIPASVISQYTGNFAVIVADYEARTGQPIRDRAAFLVAAIERQLPIIPTARNGYHNGYGITQNGFMTHLPDDWFEDDETDLPETALTDLDVQNWQAVLGQLQLQTTEATFNTWIKDTRLIGCRDGEIIVEVKSRFAKDWLENRLITTINRTVGAVFGQQLDIKFLVEGGE